MPEVVSKPAKNSQGHEMTFEQLLDSDEAAALLKIHPKTLQKWPAVVRLPVCRSVSCGASVPPF